MKNHKIWKSISRFHSRKKLWQIFWIQIYSKNKIIKHFLKQTIYSKRLLHLKFGKNALKRLMSCLLLSHWITCNHFEEENGKNFGKKVMIINLFEKLIGEKFIYTIEERSEDFFSQKKKDFKTHFIYRLHSNKQISSKKNSKTL